MREILFRGKRVDNGEWVDGCYIKGVKAAYGKSFILPENINQQGCHHLDGFNVIPETVGQFTGLTDKNGKKIFEGDVLKSDFGDGVPYEIRFGEYKVFDEYGPTNSIGFFTFPENEPFGKTIKNNTEAYLIIGNIHDNPELIK